MISQSKALASTTHTAFFMRWMSALPSASSLMYIYPDIISVMLPQLQRAALVFLRFQTGRTGRSRG